MKFTLKQKRTIVAKFKAGHSMNGIVRTEPGGMVDFGTDHVEIVIRDYMNGKFTMPKKVEGK